MIVLVTGASGMLGRAVAVELASAGHEVRTLQRRRSGIPGVTDVPGSITDAAVVQAAMVGVEAVVHLAARVSLAGDRRDFQNVNVTGTRIVLDAAEAADVTRFVQISSPSVAHDGHAIVGVGAMPADPGSARGEYARTKALAEVDALARDRPGFAALAVRPHLVWGPGDPQLVERIVTRAARGRLVLLDGGTALIDSTYIDNAATGIAAAVLHAETAHGRPYLITNGEPRPVAELLAGICLAAGVTPPARSIPAGAARAAGSLIDRLWSIGSHRDEPPMTRFLAEQLSTAHWFDPRPAREALHWNPVVSIDEGLARLQTHYATGANTRHA